MSDADLPEITELFRREYSLRYRMVLLMFHECPEACFVYEKEGKILGVAFNKIDGDELYMRQLFVRENYRREGIGNALYENRLNFARELGLKKGRANIRAETQSFHKRYSARFSEDDAMYYIIRGG